MPEKKITEIPGFQSEDEALAWWDEHGQDLDLDAMPDADIEFDVQRRPRRRATVTLRVEPSLVEAYRQLSEARDMKYSALMREVLTRWARSQMGQGRRTQAPS